MSLVAMAFLWTGSQIPVYLLGGIPPIIYADIGGVDRWVWFVLANLLALAAVCPFVGSLSDLLGRRWVSLLGSTLLVIAMIICGTAKTMNQFIRKRSKYDASHYQANISSGNGHIRDGSRHLRIDLTSCHVGVGTYSKARSLCCRSCLHHSSLLPISAMGSTHRSSQQLAVLLSLRRPVGAHGASRSSFLLSSTTTTGGVGSHQEADPRRD